MCIEKWNFDESKFLFHCIMYFLTKHKKPSMNELNKMTRNIQLYAVLYNLSCIFAYIPSDLHIWNL